MPHNIASKELTAVLRAIEPSRCYGKALSTLHADLRDGSTVVRALASEEAPGVRIDGLIHPDEVAQVRPYPRRMRAHLATKLYAAGESGMGSAKKVDPRSSAISEAPRLAQGAGRKE